MAKRIRNPIEVVIKNEDSVNSCTLHYGLGCDEYPELETRKGFTPILSPQEQATINRIVTNAINQIKQHEGI